MLLDLWPLLEDEESTPGGWRPVPAREPVRTYPGPARRRLRLTTTAGPGRGHTQTRTGLPVILTLGHAAGVARVGHHQAVTVTAAGLTATAGPAVFTVPVAGRAGTDDDTLAEVLLAAELEGLI